MNKIYTHDEAARILDMFEEVLSRYDIRVPSPEDDEREEDNMVGLYGTVYSELLDDIEFRLCHIIEEIQAGTPVVSYEFSGEY